MRQVAISIGLAVLCGGSLAGAGPPTKDLTDLSWMAGSWSTTQDGKVSEEHWTKPAAGLMLGVHRDVDGATAGAARANAPRASFEFLRIEQSAGKITYLASPQGRPATPFELVESSAQRAVFANPEHDFPQRILYWREGDALCASVEGPMNGETVSERWCWKPASLR